MFDFSLQKQEIGTTNASFTDPGTKPENESSEKNGLDFFASNASTEAISANLVNKTIIASPSEEMVQQPVSTSTVIKSESEQNNLMEPVSSNKSSAGKNLLDSSAPNAISSANDIFGTMHKNNGSFQKLIKIVRNTVG